MKWLKQSTVYLSILAFSLHSVAVYADIEKSKEQISHETQEILNVARKLERNFEDPSRPEVELDQFQLLSQTTNNDDALEIEKKIEAIQKADPNGENVEDFIDDDLPLKRYYNKNLKIQIVDANNKEIKVLDQTNAQESFSPKYFEDFSLPEGSKFRILDKNGKLLHTFHRDVDAVGFYGENLVFLEKGTFDANRGTQALRFINLDYFKGSIGNANLPVFSIPLNINETSELRIEAGKLKVGSVSLTGDAIKVLSDVYQVYFNISVALVDPRTQIRAEGLLKELVYYFGKNLELQGQTVKEQLENALLNDSKLQNLISDMQTNAQAGAEVSKLKLDSKKEIVEALEEADREKIAELAKKHSAYKENMLQTNRSMQASRLFVSRIYLLMSEMAKPQTLGSTKLIKSMVLFVEGALKNDADLRAYAKSSITKHPYFKYIKFGSFAVAAASVGSLLPEPYTFHLYQLLDLGSMLFEQAHGYISHMNYGAAFGDLYFKASKVAFSGVGSVVNYFQEGVISKFFVGLTATISIPFMVFGVPHFVVNGIKASKDMAANWASIANEGRGRLATFKEAFIQYNQNMKKDYDELMTLAEKEISRIDNSNLTDEEVEELRAIIKEKQSKGGVFKLEIVKNSMRSLKIKSGDLLKRSALAIGYENALMGKAALSMYALGEYISGNFLKESTPKSRRIDTFGKALSNFALSYASLTNTFKVLASTWNYVFIFRSFALKPATWSMALIYPQFFDRAVRSSAGVIHNPSVWNGGKTNSASLLIKKLNRSSEAKAERVALLAWEKAVLPLEKIVYEESMNKALEALVQKIDDPKKLAELFDSTQLPGNRETKDSLMAAGRPTSGVNGLTDSKLQQLSGKDLAFFRAFFTKTYDDTMSKAVKNITVESLSADQQAQIAKIESMSDLELKKYSLNNGATIDVLANLTKDEDSTRALRAKVKNTINAVVEEESIAKFATDVSTKLGFFFERRKINYHHNLLKIVDPANPQLRRFMTAENMLKKPTAVARAVRSEVAGLLVDKPLSLLTLLTLYAGVTEGIMKPFYPEAMFGPDSFFYMSRYLILNGFITGSIISIMANTWMKVQTDSRLDDAGGFDRVPTQEWRQKGFWRYYFKSMFNPKNKWSTNQMFYAKLVWSNIPAVFVMTLATNLLTLGRFDLTAFLTSYIFIFTTPFMGFGLKLEQAFELSSSWVRAQIPKKYRAHPEAQDYIQREIQKKKLMFNFFYQMYETLTGTINNLFENMNTAEYGSRSFARLLFFGYTPTELAALGIRKVGETLSFIPGAEPFTHFCENILTNNDTSLTKLPKK